MDMKKILQAFDGQNAKPQAEVGDMKRFVSIIAEGAGKLNRLTPAESIAVNHFTKQEPRNGITAPVLNVDKDAKPSMIGKYFKQAEQEFVESQERYKERSKQLAERVAGKIGGNHGHQSSFAKHVSQSQRPPESIMQMAKKGARVSHGKGYRVEDTKGIDSVTLDIPLLIRIMEYSKEDAQDDMALHRVVEKLIELSQSGETLTMDQYDAIVGTADIEERVLPGEEPPEGINRLTGKPNAPATPSAPAASGPTLSSKYDPSYEGSPAAYTITVSGQDYKFAGREKTGPGTGKVIKVPGGAVGIRGLAPVSVELGTDGMYYIAGQ